MRGLARPLLVLGVIAFALAEVLAIGNGLYYAALIILAMTTGAVLLGLVFLVLPWLILWRAGSRPKLAVYLRAALSGHPIAPPGRSHGE